MKRKPAVLANRVSNLGADSSDDNVIRIRKAVTVTSVVFGSIPVFFFIGIILLFQGETEAGIITFIFGLLMTASVVTFAISRRFVLHCIFWIILTLGSNFINIIILGGIYRSGFIILWALVAPISVLIAFTPFYSIITFFYVFIEIILLLILQPFLRQGNNLSGIGTDALTLFNITGFTGFFLLSLYHYAVQNGHLLQIIKDEHNKLKSRNDIINKDLNLARKLQEKMIPLSATVDYIYSLYKPMDEVGGDFYDFIKFRDSDKIGIFISDVSGHGVPAAFITSMLKTTILQSGNRKNNPAELMHYINDVLQSQTDDNFITAFYCIFNPADRSLLYTNAGHPQPYIISDGGVSSLQKGKSTPLAIFTNDQLAEFNKPFVNFETALPAKSRLLLYTDGMTETTSFDDKQLFFEDAGLDEFFIRNMDLKCNTFITGLYDKLVQFRGNNSFEDDVCMVCLDVK